MEKLSIEEAYKLLEEAPRNNKELWIKHSVNVAIVAERLADQLKEKELGNDEANERDLYY